MAVLQGVEKLFSLSPRKRLGTPNLYGAAGFAFSHFGDEDLILSGSGYGDSFFGVSSFGDLLLLSGIYQQRPRSKGAISVRMKFYRPSNPRTAPQQANRQEFAAAVAAWQGLTAQQKEVYRERAVPRSFSGYNLFLREYLL